MEFAAKYTNHSGESVDLMCDSAYITDCDLRDWSWSYEATSGEVTRFTRQFESKTVPFNFRGDLSGRDTMNDVFDSDIAYMEPGTFEVDGWSRRCFCVASRKMSRWVSPRFMAYEIDLLFIDPMWCLYSEDAFPIQSTGAGGLNFPYNFPHNLGGGRRQSTFLLDSVRPCDFRLTVFGHASNPYVTVGGNTYQVNVDLADGDILIVDSREGVIEKRTNSGDVSNVFNSRVKANEGSGSFIFEKLSPGYSSVVWDNSFGFNLGAYMERSEPPWNRS